MVSEKVYSCTRNTDLFIVIVPLQASINICSDGIPGERGRRSSKRGSSCVGQVSKDAGQSQRERKEQGRWPRWNSIGKRIVKTCTLNIEKGQINS